MWVKTSLVFIVNQRNFKSTDTMCEPVVWIRGTETKCGRVSFLHNFQWFRHTPTSIYYHYFTLIVRHFTKIRKETTVSLLTHERICIQLPYSRCGCCSVLPDMRCWGIKAAASNDCIFRREQIQSSVTAAMQTRAHTTVYFERQHVTRRALVVCKGTRNTRKQARCVCAAGWEK